MMVKQQDIPDTSIHFTPSRRSLLASAHATTHKPKPLSFDAVSLEGLSKGLVESH